MQITLRSFVILSSLALVLAAILVAAVMAGILARQVREIGVMKTVGACSGQIARMYGVLLLALGGLSLAIGLPLGIIAAGRLSRMMADMLNFTVTSTSVPVWVYAILIGSGLLLPLLMSWPTILRASRATVRESLANVGVSPSFGTGRLDRALAKLGGMGSPSILALRNAFRRRGRLLLALAMLSIGGALFITSLNVRDGWRAMADHVKTDRFYDADFLLKGPVQADRIASALSSVSGIGKFEIWGSSSIAFVQGGNDAVMRTYPDRGHGSFTLFGVPPKTEMIRFPLIEGRWLQESDIDAVVVTQRMLKEIPGAKIGDQIVLSIDGKPTIWRLVGVALEIGGGGAYVSSAGYANATARSGGAGGDIRLIASADTTKERDQMVRAAERALDEAGMGIEKSVPLDRLYVAMLGHIEVPAGMLIAASVLLVLVGGLGLASMMTVNVLERTREIGVMKAIGGKPATIVKIITSECLLIGGTSWFLAVLISLPLTRILGSVGRMEMGTALPFTFSIVTGAIWLGLVLVIAVAASVAPASRAAKLVVRETLAYE
jgi:putative ABC transport system permease protein